MIELVQYYEVPYSITGKNSTEKIKVCGKKCHALKISGGKYVKFSESPTLEGLISAMEEAYGVKPIKTLYVRRRRSLFPLVANCLPKLKRVFCVNFLKHNKPTDIKNIITRPRENLVKFINDINFLAVYVAKYLSTVDNRPVYPDVEPGFIKPQFPDEVPQDPISIEDIVTEFETKILRGASHWNHTQFRSYFSSPNMVADIMADFIVGSMYAVICTWPMSPSAVEFEILIVDWFGKLIGLPDQFLTHSSNGLGCGVTLNSTSEGILMAMLTSREVCFKNMASTKEERYKIHSKMVAYMSDQAHTCHERATRFAHVECRILKSDQWGSLSASTFKKALEKDINDGLIPYYLSATLGTTGIIAFDNLEELGPICEEYGIWMHVDMAYSCSAYICPEYRHYMKGIEFASSISCNPYKWLGLTPTLSTFYTKFAFEYKSSFTTDATYLKYEQQDKNRFNLDLLDTSVSLSRPFKGLRLWFHLRLYGISKLQEMIRSHCNLALYAEELIQADDRFEILKTELSVVIFRHKDSNDMNVQIINALNKSGDLQLVATDFKEKKYLRFLIGSVDENREDVEKGWQIIAEHTNQIEAEKQEAKSYRPKEDVSICYDDSIL